MKTLKTTTLIAIIFAAFVLRLLPIEWGLPGKNLTVTTYNPDEPGSYHTIEKWKPKELKFPAGATLDWGNLHLFTLASILKLGEIFGYIKVGNREFYLNNLREADRLYIVGRLISIIAGTLSVWLLYLVIQNTFRNSAIALLGSAILAIIPVHLINSFYVRPDILMVLFGLCLFYFSTKLIETGSRKHYVICAIFAGITTGTKYSGGVYLILLIIAHIIYLLQKRSFSIRKIVNKDLLLVFLIYFITFVVTCPYVLSPVFPAHIKHLLLQATKGSLYDQPGWIRYLTYFLPYGMGWPLFLSSSAGWVILLFACRKDKEPKKIFIAFSGPVIYFFISLPKFQMTWHTLPLIPFLSTYSAYFFYRFWNWENRVINTVSKFVIVFVMFYTSAYSLAHLRLYCGKNVREEASEWIDKNIPKTATIGIARSWFWTPPVLRQYNPPYKLLMGGDPINSSIAEGIVGLGRILPETDYLVVTEYEYRDFIHPKLESYFLEQARIIKEIFSEKKFKKVAEFDKEAKFLWLRFKKNYPPVDWLIPNPKIVVFKKK